MSDYRAVKICRHCDRDIPCRVGRGLCRRCWNDPAIRAKYKPVCKFGGAKAAMIGNDAREAAR